MRALKLENNQDEKFNRIVFSKKKVKQRNFFLI